MIDQLPPQFNESGVLPDVSRWISAWLARNRLSRQFWIFFLAALFFDFGFAMFFFLYNLFLLDLGYNERQLGFIGGAMTFGMVAGTLPIGMLAQKRGLRTVLLAGFVLTSIVGGLRTLFVTEQAQIVLAFLFGCCICFWAVCFAPSAAQVTEEKNRPLAFSLLMSVGIGIGGVAGLVGGWLPGWLQTLNASLQPAGAKRLVLLLCCAIAILGVWPVLCVQLPKGPRQHTGAWSFPPYLMRYLPAMVLWSFAAGAFIPFATAYFSRAVHISLAHIGIIFSASQLAQVLAILLAPFVFRRCGLVAGIAYTQMAAAFALAALAASHHISIVVVFFLAFTGFHWMGGPGIYSLLMDRVPESERSNASAANSFVTNLCQAAASAIAGAAYVDFGYPLVLAGIAATAFFAALLFWTLLRDPRDQNAVVNAPAQC